ncbi:Cupredoxin, partial [Tuber magnatum]
GTAVATHIVTVGGTAGLVYTPSQISAAVGDLVHFIFMSNNHSVTQSTFAAPCNRLATGMDSDLMPNPNNSIVPPPLWEYTVTTSEPTWWYCKQRMGNHCGKGMVFAINPTADKTFQMFLDTAVRVNGTVSSTPAAVGTGTATAVATALPSAVAGAGSEDCKCQCFCPTAAY